MTRMGRGALDTRLRGEQQLNLFHHRKTGYACAAH
jgi:hypothetical protein